MTIPSLEQPKIEIESAPTPESPSVPGRPQNSDTAIVPLPQSRSRSPLKRWSHRIAWTLLFTGTALSAAVAGALIATTTPLPGWLVGESSEPLSLVDLWQSGFRYRVTRPVNILLLGVDEVPDATPGSEEVFSGRTDTMLLARFNPDKSTLSVLSIPRDTRVEVPGDGIAKINHANIVGGPEKVAETIQSNLGPVAIDRYVRVNTEGVRELIDLIGGVEVYVPQPMVYEDKTQGLYINLQPGWQTLNGDQAEQFARFRSDGQGDIGRVQRQQILLQALRERLMSPRVIPQLPQMIRVMLRYIDKIGRAHV